jgi:signal peptidase I
MPSVAPPEQWSTIVPEGKPRRRPVRWLLRQVEHVLALVGLGTLVYFACFNLSRVTSDSMAPTLRGKDCHTGDLVLTERVSLRFRQPRRWEVIAFSRDDGLQVMKRVVGLPGERVQMRRGGRIFINGHEAPPPASLAFLRYFPVAKVFQDKAVDCGDGYFVLGDDSRDSDDSRYNGPVPPGDVIGRAWLILGPKEHRGFVNP